MHLIYSKTICYKDAQSIQKKINAATMSELEKWGIECIDAEQ